MLPSVFLFVLADQHVGYQRRLTCLTARFHGLVQIDPLASDIIKQNQTAMAEWDCRVGNAAARFKDSILDYKIPPSQMFPCNNPNPILIEAPKNN